MAHSPHTELLALPQEIMSTICSFLSKPDLKNVRFTCHYLECSAVSSLFDEVFVSFSEFDLRIASLVIHSFAPYIKTLVFSSMLYEDIPFEAFRPILAINDFPYGLNYQLTHSKNPNERNERQERLAYLHYKVLYQTRRNVVVRGKCLKFLKQNLERLHECQTIRMGIIDSSRDMSVQHILEHGDLPEASILARELLCKNSNSYRAATVCLHSPHNTLSLSPLDATANATWSSQSS